VFLCCAFVGVGELFVGIICPGLMGVSIDARKFSFVSTVACEPDILGVAGGDIPCKSSIVAGLSLISLLEKIVLS